MPNSTGSPKLCAVRQRGSFRNQRQYVQNAMRKTSRSWQAEFDGGSGSFGTCRLPILRDRKVVWAWGAAVRYSEPFTRVDVISTFDGQNGTVPFPAPRLIHSTSFHPVGVRRHILPQSLQLKRSRYVCPLQSACCAMPCAGFLPGPCSSIAHNVTVRERCEASTIDVVLRGRLTGRHRYMQATHLLHCKRYLYFTRDVCVPEMAL